MAGGSIRAPNKIGRGYAVALRPTGVASAGERGWPEFRRGSPLPASSTRSPIGLEAGAAGMAEKRRFSVAQVRTVARASSHGRRKAERSQADGPQRRLMAGLAARPDPQRLAERAGGAAPPFGSAGAGTRVAHESRGSSEFQALEGPQSCLRLRSGLRHPHRINGSGPRAALSTPENGVGGAGRSASTADARNGSAGRGNGAEGRKTGGVRHEADAPFVERTREATPTGAAVNEWSQMSVENSA
jgi:hypothetical protein